MHRRFLNRLPPAWLLLYVVPAMLGSCARRAGSGPQQNEQLYAECEQHSDCRGSGLLCDERRGCVECLEDDDCKRSQSCSLGLCESDSSEQNAPSEHDAAAEKPSTSKPADETNRPGTTDAEPDAAPAPVDDPVNGPSGPANTPTDPAPSVGPASPDPDPNPTPANSQPAEPTPPCAQPPCAASCGDGIVASGEACDDGNAMDGDGCSSTCQVEGGATCEITRNGCEKIGGVCVLRVPATFRDFSGDHLDFGDLGCSTLSTGLVQSELDDQGRPVLIDGTNGCIRSKQSFAEWYVDGANSVTVPGELVLFADGDAFSNRYGPNGERWTVSETGSDSGGSTSLEDCESYCEQVARNTYLCDNTCAPAINAAAQAEFQLTRARNEGADANTIADLEQDVADAQLAVEICETECDAAVEDETATCSASCAPCSFDASLWCSGGKTVQYDGTPTFFPVDGVDGPTRDPDEAQIPEEYGAAGYPWESRITGEAAEHNFYFTTEMHVPFEYEPGMHASVTFVGDDDAWLFINGKLAIDLGGPHVPELGSATIEDSTAAQYGLVEGINTLSIFHAEREKYGSTFRLTLSGFGFEAGPPLSVCTP